MPDRIEEILKKIHVLFAKGGQFEDSPDLVVVSKQEMFEQLEQLNEALDELLDKYEATTRSRERARLELDRQNAEAVAEAKKNCDDVHAASLIYTDSMLDGVNEIIDKARQAVKHDLIETLAALEEQQEILVKNRDGVKQELSEMHDNELYLGLLEKLRKREEEKRRYGQNIKSEEEELFDEKPSGKPNLIIRVDNPGDNSGISVSTKRSHKLGKRTQAGTAASGEATPDTDPGSSSEEEVPVPKGTVFTADDFNLDAEYEQWKEDQETPEKKDAPSKKHFSLFPKKKP